MDQRISIIVDDEMIGMDREFYRIENLAALCPDELHALQWYPEQGAGEEEYKNGPNVVIASLDAYQGAIDAWTAARDAAIAEAEAAANEGSA